jgi:hypothetical protein
MLFIKILSIGLFEEKDQLQLFATGLLLVAEDHQKPCNCNQWSSCSRSSPGPVLVFFWSIGLDLETLIQKYMWISFHLWVKTIC